ncbi:VPLPA-CTERM-specific exosortase XrtD [Methylobacter sp. BlB1]|uniref:VPLPA-CTERM-specific exosortase XrtD n=1 Tax=Methylobacter sp. BlB1 TaxID=2785914 RepID=UPI001893151A|nr:VPLPA-CTERM-specific exosortase XrtD [Methylobacter sp. BlB1]MBF6650518.1 VPLPA-CTERM-specific exosortase XrtD [Methylobacter sp. BlB1]
MNKALAIWKFDYRYLALISFALLLLLTAFAGGLQELLVRWEKQEEYSHGYMLPLITLYFIWQRRNLIQQSDFSPSWVGFGIVLLALAVFMVGEISALFILIQYAFIAVLIGIALSIMGWPAVKPVIVPILLLAFAIPLPYFLEASLSANLQLLSSKLGVYFIRWCQIPVYLEGNIIDLGGYKLQVVEACSGLRYLFPLMSLGFICAYMYNTVFWKRALVFLSTIPITLFMNSFRIAVIGVLVDNWGSSMAEGFLHDFEGWVVFMACLGILVAEMILLSRLDADRRPFAEIFGLAVDPSVGDMAEAKVRPLSRPFFAIIAGLVVTTITVFSIDKRAEVFPERKNFPLFPMQLSDWQGQQASMENTVIDKLGLSDYILADFKQAQGAPVNLYAAYYASQRKGISPHSPRVCIPGGGWQIAEIERKNLGLLDVNRIVIKKGDMTQLVYYWFQQRGRKMANEYLMKWYLFKDALLLNRTDGALVRLTTMVNPGESLDLADQRLQGLAKEVLPVLPQYIPD